MAPDSVAVLVAVPGVFEFKVPLQWVWNTSEHVASGVLVALAAFWLARRRFKSERWHERRGEIYGKIIGLLHIINRDSHRLSDVEDQAYQPETFQRFSAEDLQSFREKRRAAHDQLGELFEEHRYLLSSSARGILGRYNSQTEELWDSDTHYLDTCWHNIVRPIYRDFREIYNVDVGIDWGFSWRLRRSCRAIMRQWGVAKSRIELIRYQIQRWQEDRKLLRGPQLTQADVRTPPKHKHFKSVQEMERLGWSKAMIQRTLRQQRAADPPPWESSRPHS